MLYTYVFTSFNVALYLAQGTSLQLGQFAMLYAPVFTSLIVT